MVPYVHVQLLLYDTLLALRMYKDSLYTIHEHGWRTDFIPVAYNMVCTAMCSKIQEISSYMVTRRSKRNDNITAMSS